MLFYDTDGVYVCLALIVCFFFGVSFHGLVDGLIDFFFGKNYSVLINHRRLVVDYPFR